MEVAAPRILNTPDGCARGAVRCSVGFPNRSPRCEQRARESCLDSFSHQLDVARLLEAALDERLQPGKLLRRVQHLRSGEWNPRVWDMSEVYNLMYLTASHLEFQGALKHYHGRGASGPSRATTPLHSGVNITVDGYRCNETNPCTPA
eukprot:2074265-Pyramimonas_sp.AAC.1